MKYFSSDLNHISENMIDNFEDDIDISDELADTSDLPTSVIVTNMDSEVFVDEYKKVFYPIFNIYCYICIRTAHSLITYFSFFVCYIVL